MISTFSSRLELEEEAEKSRKSLDSKTKFTAVTTNIVSSPPSPPSPSYTISEASSTSSLCNNQPSPQRRQNQILTGSSPRLPSTGSVKMLTRRNRRSFDESLYPNGVSIEAILKTTKLTTDDTSSSSASSSSDTLCDTPCFSIAAAAVVAPSSGPIECRKKRLKRSKSVSFNNIIETFIIHPEGCNKRNESPLYQDLPSEAADDDNREEGWMAKGVSFLFSLVDTIQWCSALLSDHYQWDDLQKSKKDSVRRHSLY